MEVSGRHARTRPITRGTVSPVNLPFLRDEDASRGVARVVSAVSVLCPRLVARAGNADAWCARGRVRVVALVTNWATENPCGYLGGRRGASFDNEVTFSFDELSGGRRVDVKATIRRQHQATETAPKQARIQSPLTDSNR